MSVKKNSPRPLAEWMLAAATLFWGWTFPVVKDAVSQMPVFAFLGLRFALAAIYDMAAAGEATVGEVSE